MGNKAASWIAGTVLVALVLTALGWQFAINPMMTEASEMRAQTESEQSRVDQLEITLAGLQRDFENIDEFQEQLEELRTEIPAAIDISEVTRSVTTMSQQAGVVIVGSATTTAVDITPAAPAPAPTTTTAEETTEAASEAAGATTDSAASTPPAATDVLYAVPVEYVTIGGYEQTLSFLSAVQASHRLMLVSGVQLTGQDPAAAQAGRPATVDGDVEARISAWVFVILSPDGTTELVPADGEEVPEPTLPVPSGQKNPFVPQS